MLMTVFLSMTGISQDVIDEDFTGNGFPLRVVSKHFLSSLLFHNFLVKSQIRTII